MKICIHRGINQIGGSIIEISSETTRLFFDVGVNLDEGEAYEVPRIEGLFEGEKRCDGIFISHYHSDHIGLLGEILSDIPIYMGEKAFYVFRSAFDYRGKQVTFQPLFVQNQIGIEVGDIKVTPYQCDHSAFDSYMFVVESNGKRILYTGDFRANGRMNYDELLKMLPSVDAIITEGTTLSRETEVKNIDEIELENIAVNYIENIHAPVFIMMSSTNVERVITAYNIARRTDRIFMEDIYTAEISMAVGEIAPEANVDEGIRVFTTGGDKQYQRLQAFGKAKIGRKEIAKTPFLMCIRQSMKSYLEKLNELISFDGGVLLYGMWKGYLEQPEMKEFIKYLKNKGVKIHIIHTSGHADAYTIRKLIDTVSPSYIIPVHTENPCWFNQFQSENCKILNKNIIEL
ncbi:MAG: MBL fold metallo-hydrolase [Lachnospiraceae bacterium]|nr:MBL fold metallo-hydrolase [Lachnospiraceae bacterium]